MFLVNSRLGHFSAPNLRWVPLSRSYGVNLPSSLAVIHSSTLGFSPHPPVSVYGTGCHALDDHQIFLQVWLPGLSALPKDRRTFGFQSPYGLQRGLPSPRAGFTPRSLTLLHDMFRNFDRMSITCPSRVPLSSRLTLIRLALFRKPWVFGEGVSTPFVVTYAYIFFSGRSSTPHGRTFFAVRNAPLPLVIQRVHGFGGSLDARSSSTQRRSTSELLRTL